MKTLSSFQEVIECGSISKDYLEKEVLVTGWVQRRRDLGGLIFIDLRDRTGIVQVVFDSGKDMDMHKQAESLRSEYVLSVRGVVRGRPIGTENKDIPTGFIEIQAAELTIINTAKTTPFVIADDSNVDEGTRMRYRYLDLRRPKMFKNLLLRHKVTKAIRDFFDREGFLEVETPMFIKSTPEGARDYLVPSRVYPGKFYALPQSPQLFKQILMVAGIGKYFQIARCFRDEDLRADRQPEFTQIDVEMSFIQRDDILEIIEELLAFVFDQTLGITIATPFLRLPHSTAMEKYGSDKPDLRFDLPIQNLTKHFSGIKFDILRQVIDQGGAVKAIVVHGGAKEFSRKGIDELNEWFKSIGGRGILTAIAEKDTIKSPLAKHLSEEQTAAFRSYMTLNEGDMVFIAADTSSGFSELMGKLRLELIQRLKLKPSVPFHFSFVVDFPLLRRNAEENRWEPEHHPFTSPLTEDFHLMESAPGEVRAAAYDTVLNGNELGSGSIRIHERELQEKIFTLLDLSKEQAYSKFGFLLDAFEYGAPPHGGIALGLDRLIMLMAGEESIREVIAFPKNQSGSCPMTGAPVEVGKEQLDLLKIRFDIPAKS